MKQKSGSDKMTIVEAREWKKDLIFTEYNQDKRMIPMIFIIELDINNDIDFDKYLADKWEMIIYFHRNKITADTTVPPEDNSIVIKHYKESQILLTLARKIDIQIFEREKFDEDQNQQTYDKKNYRYENQRV